MWDVLADGWLYPLWVVGASRMREVDDTWPAVGSKLHHSVGAWPALINDDTEVTDVEPLPHARAAGQGWPFLARLTSSSTSASRAPAPAW